MSVLSRQEEHIMLAIWRLGGDAYAIPIRKYLKEMTGHSLSIGGIYVPLDRLVRKGYIISFQSEPKPERGGMSRRYYQLTKEGVQVLKNAKKVHEKLWDGLKRLSVMAW